MSECIHREPRAYCKWTDGCRDCITDLQQQLENQKAETDLLNKMYSDTHKWAEGLTEQLATVTSERDALEELRGRVFDDINDVELLMDRSLGSWTDGTLKNIISSQKEEIERLNIECNFSRELSSKAGYTIEALEAANKIAVECLTEISEMTWIVEHKGASIMKRIAKEALSKMKGGTDERATI